ncbi:C-type lectin domain family 10 member A-like isoform X1 [Mobula hypostoma]|uniref:C-type lectin domain family 10 member A-like isoform X1 n=1 Tax=Mobula hypostoma TaxID=723540 RepID=UPI002FC3602F
MEMMTKNENLCENQTDDPSAEGHKPERRKSGNRLQPAMSVPGNLSPMLIYTLLGFCILLSVAVLIVTLMTRTFNETKGSDDSFWMKHSQLKPNGLETSDADLCMENSLWRSNLTQILSEITTAAAGLQTEFSQWRSHVAGNYDEAASSIAELRNEISQLSKKVINSKQTLSSIAKMQDEILQLSNDTETSIGGVRDELSQWKSNVAENFKKIGSSIAELHNDILQLNNNIPQCPTDWIRFRKSCYQFSSRTQIWAESQRHCASVDAHLVVINNEEEQEFLRRTLQMRYWIGLSDTASEGDWRWVDGTDYSSSLTYWSEGEPNDGDHGEDCAEIFDNGKWNDLPCSNIQHWICEKSALIPP